jgi:bifunctional enzyme CysN/CysC
MDDLSKRTRRWTISGQRGGTVWITGLPASGKSTLAAALETRLLDRGTLAYRLDGDELRSGFSEDLGFDRRSRSEHARRVAWMASFLADLGAVSIVSLISPYAEDRQSARELHRRRRLSFVEVFVDTPLAECIQRDPDRLYARALAGELLHVTGVNDPYERPTAPDLEVHPDGFEPQPALGALIALLEQKGIGSRM